MCVWFYGNQGNHGNRLTHGKLVTMFMHTLYIIQWIRVFEKLLVTQLVKIIAVSESDRH